ncbi:MAG: hypothetical protein H7211_17670 [Aquabacterium sp.]|nr:hypothetical protein [Ferruginibacter sp.]
MAKQEGLNHEDIGAKIGLSGFTVKTHMHQ